MTVTTKDNTRRYDDRENDQGLTHTLSEVSLPDLKALQSVTLQQMLTAGGEERTVLIRVWQRLEAERRRRIEEVEELERIYFGRECVNRVLRIF